MPSVTIYYVEETHRWQCAGANLISVGETMQEALANWLADWKRTNDKS